MALQLGKGILGRVIGIGVSLAIAFGAYYIWNKGKEKVAEANAPDVGVCLQVKGSTLDPEHEEVDCDDPVATYEVVGNKGSCDEAELNYTISLGTGSDNEGNVADLCLALNAAKGDCFMFGTISSPGEKVDCAANRGDTGVWKVVAVADGASDTCPGGKAVESQPNKTRDRLVCLGPNA